MLSDGPWRENEVLEKECWKIDFMEGADMILDRIKFVEIKTKFITQK